jgi:hypothetical protein
VEITRINGFKSEFRTETEMLSMCHGFERVALWSWSRRMNLPK